MFEGNRNVRFATILVLISAGLLTLSAQALAQNPHIDLTVVESAGVAKMQFQNSACPQHPNDKGCVSVDRGNRSWISWEIDQASWQNGWRITELHFSPDGTHWGESGYPLMDCTVFDFGLTETDRMTGVASSAQSDGNGKRMKIWDENNNRCETWYRLFAENIDTGETADSDPVIRNGGRD